MQLPAETIAFFLSGLTHQFGNLLLTIQGNTLALERLTPERARAAILGAVERGSASLEVLRVMLGQRSAAAASAQALLGQLLELSRVPLRERGWTVSAPPMADPGIGVATAPFVRAAAIGVHWLAATVPEGAPGFLEARLARAGAGACTLRLAFEAAPGALPFPLPLRELVAAMASEVPSGVHVRPEPGANAVELRFASTTGGVLPSSAEQA